MVTKTLNNSQFPWKSTAGTFFAPISIDPNRWDKLFPYRLVVVDQNNKIVSGGDTLGVKLSPSNNDIEASPDNFRIVVQPIFSKWEYRLPVTPQQLSISTPFANTASATLRGITEEHSGVRFKIINMAGTFGNWPGRVSTGESLTQDSVQNLFAGTIQAANNVGSTIARIKNIATQNSIVTQPTKGPEEGIGGMYGTGYAMALMLDQFLEQFAEAKRNTKEAKGWRLVLDIPKQNQSFVVQPVGFNWSQDANAPTQVRFSLQLKAWKRIDLSNSTGDQIPSIQPLNSSIFQRVLNSINNARIAVGQSLTLVKAVRSDFQKPLTALRQTALFVKGLAGVPAAVADLPSQIVYDYKTSIKDSFAIIASSLSQSTQNEKVKKSLFAIMDSRATNEGLSDTAVQAGQLGYGAVVAQMTDPSNEIFNNPDENFELLNALNINQLNISPLQAQSMNSEFDNVSLITVDDLIEMKTTIQELASQIANAFGAGDSVVNKMNNKGTPIFRASEMTIDEYALLKSLYDVVQSYDILTATQEIDNGRIASSMEFVGGLADAVGMPFEQPSSKIMAPVPFNLTIEQISARYLGDSQRWTEIATLNALKAPYIDEEGFERKFLSNADGRRFNIGSGENLYVGQKINLLAVGQMMQSRRIIDLEKISDTNYLVTVDGLADLDSFTVGSDARMRAYLPGTTNSQNQIWIPSDLPSEDEQSRPIPALRDEVMVGLSKVDWLLDDQGDLAVNAYGDLRLSAGLTNMIQALKMKFMVPHNKLLLHPEYGAGIEIGAASVDVDPRSIYKQIEYTISLDPRFGGLERLEVIKSGNTMTVNVSVKSANGKGIFPLSFKLQ